jgi:ankyrin repeat protein
VEAGADVNTWDIFGQAPLFVALDNRALPKATRGLAGVDSELGGLDLMRMLLERGANPNMQLAFRPAHRTGSGMVQVISRGTTPLIRAAVAADIDAMKLLIANGAEVNLGNADGTTAMMAVFIPSRLRAPVKTEAQALEVLRVLHAAGADVNRIAGIHPLQRTRGGTVLHLATRLGWKEAMAEVVSYGVDVNAKDQDGLTALDYALSRGYVDFLQQKPPVREDLAAMLRGWGATVEDPKPRNWPPVSAPLYFKHLVPPL